MVLKEFPSITKEGNTIVNKSGDLAVVGDFVKQMSKRGNQSLVCYFNELKNNDPKTSEDEVINGVCWSENFKTEDLIYLIMVYVNSNFTPRQKKLFAKRLENAFIENEIYEEEYDEYEDEYDDD